EALRNVGRHARANRAVIALNFTPREIMLTIRDDGIGFDTAERAAERALGGHFGLLGARERAESVSARLEVESAPGKGTTLKVTSAIPQPLQIPNS
ncbi:MAG TPA: sensor histidine kinase, partial [Promineifilum sp.]|nr:sensor histidine kinase [Promineifilum sp.]